MNLVRYLPVLLAWYLGTTATTSFCIQEQAAKVNHSLKLNLAVDVLHKEIRLSIENMSDADQVVYIGWRRPTSFVPTPLHFLLKDSHGIEVEIEPTNAWLVLGGRLDELFIPLLKRSTYSFLLSTDNFVASSGKRLTDALTPESTLTAILTLDNEHAPECPSELAEFVCWRGEVVSNAVRIQTP
jgi:hypothetical protein